MTPIMKFRYISFIGMIEDGSIFFRQIKYLDKYSKYQAALKKSMYQDTQDFLKKYRKKLDDSANSIILYNKETKNVVG